MPRGENPRTLHGPLISAIVEMRGPARGYTDMRFAQRPARFSSVENLLHVIMQTNQRYNKGPLPGFCLVMDLYAILAFHKSRFKIRKKFPLTKSKFCI